MSVDVFGHQLTKSKVRNGSTGARGPPGEGFMITKDGQFNLQTKRLCNIGYPKEINDAAPIKYIHDLITEEKRIINQAITSLQDSNENHQIIINTLHSNALELEKNYMNNIQKVEDLTMRNVKLIQNLDSRLVKLEKTCLNILDTIKKLKVV